MGSTWARAVQKISLKTMFCGERGVGGEGKFIESGNSLERSH